MKYPKELVSFIKNDTMSIDAHFVKNMEDKPLKVFDDTFSRYGLTIINSKKAVATANIPINKISSMSKKTDYAFNKWMDQNYTSNSDNESSPGFTTRFFSGNLKGKSPVEVLLENKNGEELLKAQYQWLDENLDKYPKNKLLMDAIEDALKADLSKTVNKMTSSKPVEILKIDVRPLVRKKNENGLCFCYECIIVWDNSKLYPVSVNVKNYYAPVDKTPEGLFNVHVSQKDKSTEINNTFNLSVDDWLYTMDELIQAKKDFVGINRKEAFDLSEKAFIENMKK